MNKDLENIIYKVKRKKKISKIKKKSLSSNKNKNEKNLETEKLLKASKCPFAFLNLFDGGLFSYIALKECPFKNTFISKPKKYNSKNVNLEMKNLKNQDDSADKSGSF